MSPLDSAWLVVNLANPVNCNDGLETFGRGSDVLMESAQPRRSHIRRLVCKSNILKAPHVSRPALTGWMLFTRLGGQSQSM